MNEKQLMENYRADWDELDRLLRLKKLSKEELLSLDELYRSALTHFSLVSTHYPNGEAYTRLRPLVARAHNQIYSAKEFWSFSLSRVLFQDIPRVLKKRLVFIGLAFLLLYGSAVAAFILCSVKPDIASLMVPPEYMEIDYGEFDQRDWNRTVTSSLIMTNNIKVMINTFALGVTGIGTVYILLVNGMLLGAVFSLAAGQQALINLVAWIMPHGILELTAIGYGSAAGLLLVYTLVFPGPYRRQDVMSLVGKDCLLLVGLAVPMLIIA
ncbi:MAG: stage II sporulation protein M, partial [Peptococcaceae bacterium]|nr:stage II sporulation protein M [Peptococcaceae bacterium]